MNKIFDVIKSVDKSILIIISILGCVSLLMLESTIYDDGLVLGRAVVIQGVAYVLGFIAMAVVLSVNYNVFFGMEKILYIISIIVLCTVYIPGLGVEQYGATAWIKLGPLTLQPSEFVKITFVLIMSGYLSTHREELQTFKGVFKALMVAAPIIAIVLKDDLGSALVYIVGWIFMVFFAGIDYKLFLRCALLSVASIPIIYRFLGSYQKDRIEAFLHPDNLSLPGNYQVWQSKVAIGSGGFTGKGLFQGVQKSLDFIPVQQSDFIFSVVVEELGFLGGLFVICMYGLLVWRYTCVLRDTEDMYGALIIVGFIGMFLFQFFENIGMTMGIMPVTGITLPFMSGGGTSVLASMMIVGLILNVGVNSRGIKF